MQRFCHKVPIPNTKNFSWIFVNKFKSYLKLVINFSLKQINFKSIPRLSNCREALCNLNPTLSCNLILGICYGDSAALVVLFNEFISTHGNSALWCAEFTDPRSMGQTKSGWLSPFGTTSLKFVNTIMIPGGNRGSCVLSGLLPLWWPCSCCCHWIGCLVGRTGGRSLCGRRNKRWNVKRRKALKHENCRSIRIRHSS